MNRYTHADVGLADRGPGTAARERDRELIERIHHQDPAALEELLRLYWSPLVDYVARILNGDGSVEDVVQDAFVWVWTRRMRWKPGGSLRSLLYRVARNVALDQTRRRDVRIRAADAVRELSAGRRPSTPVEVLEQAELRAALDRAIASLPARRREVFTLAYVHGLSHAEISAMLDIAPQTVKNQVSSALAGLRKELEPLLD